MNDKEFIEFIESFKNKSLEEQVKEIQKLQEKNYEEDKEGDTE